ncbi:MAG: hypothetical protein Q8934_20230 [Bacillota bacterium]|nr:hypothetical protein [Bacillota bacterium]
MMSMYDVLLMAEQKKQEIERNARDAWMYSMPKETRSFWNFLKKKQVTPFCECIYLCES